ncbi:MAG: helix-turn-helix transcriptional regulator, partial [Carnobacterium sp.]
MNKLKELRGSMTQDRLAKILGVSQRTYSNYETDERQVPDDIKIKLADYFNVSIDFLLGQEKGQNSIGNVNGNNNETVAISGSNNNFLKNLNT